MATDSRLARPRARGLKPERGAGSAVAAERSAAVLDLGMAQFGKQYVQTDLDADREVANTLADLIIGGLLTTGEIADHDDDADPE